MKEQLQGIVERVTFHNPETGFAVLRVQPQGRRGLVTVVGTIARVVPGEYVDATGNWTQDRDHGLQFRAEELRTTPPATCEGLIRYLSSGLIKGIGPHFARKIVDVFGERTLAVLDESPAFLQEIKGIGPRRLQRIRESWREQKVVRDLMVFLQSHGVGTSRAVRIYKTYGEQALEVVRSNPYRLATDIWGIGFTTADQLAARLGIDRASPLRARAAVLYVLQQLANEGHCAFPESGVLARTVRLTNISPVVVKEALEHQRLEGALVREPFAGTLAHDPWFYLKPLFLAELGVARALHTLLQEPHPLPPGDWSSALEAAERRMGLTLAAAQRQALQQATRSKVLVITGGPGTGKSTLVRGILEIFTAQGLRCALCAPTGRAAKRLSDTTGRPAKTIHRLLEFDPGLGGFRRDRDHPLDLDLLVVDEVSMVDVVLMNQLLRAVPRRACVVFVGDVDQLPSVGPGTVLADLIASGSVPVVRLTEIFRQAEQSGIVRAAHQVNRGQQPASAPPDSGGDFYFIAADTPQNICERLLYLVRQRIPERFGLDPLRDIQVLTPMNRSELGARNLNLLLQQALNPAPSATPERSRLEVQRYGWTFRVGDKVLQTVNNYQKEVFNGDIGRIVSIDPVEQELCVDFDGRQVSYDFHELDELTLAYACSIHKAQGSEYPAVVIPLHMQHAVLLQRNLLYTGITRGRKLVVLLGQRRALALAVQRQDTSQRYTALRWRLQQQLRKDTPSSDLPESECPCPLRSPSSGPSFLTP